jgi:hypothetical protein
MSEGGKSGAKASLPCAWAVASGCSSTTDSARFLSAIGHKYYRKHGDRHKPFKDKRVILAADNRQRRVFGTRSWTLGQLGRAPTVRDGRAIRLFMQTGSSEMANDSDSDEENIVGLPILPATELCIQNVDI